MCMYVCMWLQDVNKTCFQYLRLPRSYTLYAVEANIENISFLYAWQSLGIKMLHPVSLFFLFFPSAGWNVSLSFSMSQANSCSRDEKWGKRRNGGILLRVKEIAELAEPGPSAFLNSMSSISTISLCNSMPRTDSRRMRHASKACTLSAWRV